MFGDVHSDVIVHGRLSPNGDWSAGVLSGSGGQFAADEVVIAARWNHLHLLRRVPPQGTTPGGVMWSYTSGGLWSAETRLTSASSFYTPSLINGGPGLIAAIEEQSHVSSSMIFTQQPPSSTLPC